MAYRVPDGSEIEKLWDKADKALRAERRSYWLNAAFYSGHQWLQWNTQRGWLELMPERAEGDPHQVTMNLMGPRIDSLVGRFINRTLSWETQPSGVDDASMRGARLAEFVLDAENQERDWEATREENLLNSLLGGVSGVMIDWREDGGDDYDDPYTGESYKIGCVDLNALALPEFTLEPGVRRPQDARWWMGCTMEPPAVIAERFGMLRDPKPDALGATNALQRKLLRDADVEEELTRVFSYWRRPAGDDRGCVVWVVNGQVVRRLNEWPFPFRDRLNLQVFRIRKVNRKWFGETFVSSARSPQVQYNDAWSLVFDHIDKVANPRFAVPLGSVLDEEEFSNLVGEVFKYHKDAGEPHWMTAPEMPRFIPNTISALKAEVDDILYTHATSRGELVGSRNSGLALSLVTEKDDSPLGSVARDQARGWGEIGTMALECYETLSRGPRRATVTTDGGVAITKEWQPADLSGQTRVRVPIDQTKPTSKVATQAALIAMKNAFPEVFAMMDPVTVGRMFELPTPDLMAAVADSDAAFAEYENAVMMGDEVCVPEEWHNHAKHIAQHNRQRNTPAYRNASESVRELLDAHVKTHTMLAAEEMQGQQLLDQAEPGASAIPQASAPPGSDIPPTMQEQMAAMSAQQMTGASPPA